MAEGEFAPLTPHEMLTKDVDELKGVIRERREAAEKDQVTTRRTSMVDVITNMDYITTYGVAAHVHLGI